MLPAWIPGSYMIREFARNIVRISAVAGDRKVPIEKLDKHTWRAAPVKGALEVACEVYAWDLSVRAAHLDESHGFFNGPSVFLLPIGQEHEPCSVDILPPAGARYSSGRSSPDWGPRVALGDWTSGRTSRSDYDELIDCPVEMGEFELGRFDVLGVPHEIAVTGRVPKFDMKRLTTDLARVCEQQVRLFEPRTRKAPFARYTFMTLAVGDGYGGLEHRNSTALICRRDDLPYEGMKEATSGYRTFLGLASHEYFHSWNVKRIRPAAFVPYDLTRENHTRLLWAFEGFHQLLRRPAANPRRVTDRGAVPRHADHDADHRLQRTQSAEAKCGREFVRRVDQVLPPGRERAQQRGELLPEGFTRRARAGPHDPQRNKGSQVARRCAAPALAPLQGRGCELRRRR